jgi:hypothetical protein
MEKVNGGLVSRGLTGPGGEAVGRYRHRALRVLHVQK